MNSKFNYKAASVQEISEHFVTISRQAIWLVKNYYKNDSSTLEKLVQAEKEAKVVMKRQKIKEKYNAEFGND